MNYDRPIKIYYTTVGDLINVLSNIPRDFKVLVPVYPPGDDTSNHCTVDVWKNEVEIEGIYENKETWDRE